MRISFVSCGGDVLPPDSADQTVTVTGWWLEAGFLKDFQHKTPSGHQQLFSEGLRGVYLGPDWSDLVQSLPLLVDIVTNQLGKFLDKLTSNNIEGR